MIAALLLPLVFAADSAPVDAELRKDPPIQIWISNDQRFLQGERAKVQVRTEYDGYLLVLQVDPEGYLRVLVPLDPDKDNFVRGGKKYEVRGRGDREAFETDAKGRGTVYAAVSREPFRFDGFVAGDHWDYRALAPTRLSTNPETELNELIRRLAQGDFDYDLLAYDVVDHSTYASDYYPSYYGAGYSDPYCYSFCGHGYYGSPFSVSIAFGGPYRSYYYDPYFYAYNPFYNPFFYNPYYYAPAYYPRYIYPHPYYPYPYRNGYYGNNNYRSNGQPFTPYRFRGADGFPAGYRGRGADFRSPNTIYNPPATRVREPAIATPARRIIDPAAEPLPNGTARSHLIDDARRVQSRPIEAHRARPENGENRSAGEPRLTRREVENRPSDSDRGDPRGDRARDVRPSGPRGQSDRGAREAPPRREAAGERSSPPPSPDRGSGRSESTGGGSHEGGGNRPSGDDGRRHR